MEPIKEDHAPSAILELVDGPRDMRFAMTAKTLVRERASESGGIRELTAKNVAKVTRFRKDGEQELEAMVRRLEDKGTDEERRGLGVLRRRVYKPRDNPISKNGFR